MKLNILFSALALLCSTHVLLSQKSIDISFEKATSTITRGKSDIIVPVKVKIDKEKLKAFPNYHLDIVVNEKESTLSSNEYSFSFRKIPFDQCKSLETVFVTIKKDSLPDRERSVVLNLRFTRNDTIKKIINDGKYRFHTIASKPFKAKSNGYEYLGYVGTNFDLVEGIRAKDLFFAANILNRPEDNVKKNFGFYLSLYGNRAFSRSDSTSVFRLRRVLDTIDDNIRIETRSGRAFETETTDNLGAYISPLVRWPFKHNKNAKVKLYYAPSLEFVYRRTRIIRSPIKFSQIDTVSVSITDENNGTVSVRELPNNSSSQTFNEFSFNAGILGLFLVHENKRISVRVHGSVGLASNYFADGRNAILSRTNYRTDGDIFFSGRAWITEPKSGITLQAEVTNLFNNPRPFFVATLSKAFDFKDLGSVFKPITPSSK